MANISTSDGYDPSDVIQMLVECYDGMEYVNTSEETHIIPNNNPDLASIAVNPTTGKLNELLNFIDTLF